MKSAASSEIDFMSQSSIRLPGFVQANPGASPVFIDEVHTGCLEGSPYNVERSATRLMRPGLKLPAW